MSEQSSHPEDGQPDQDATQPFTRPGADSDATRQLPPTGRADDADATQVADAWTGRAEVRGPTPAADTEEWIDQGEPEPGRRWWLPILLGLLAILLVFGAVAAFVALSNNSGGGPNPTPTPSHPAPTSAAPSPTSAPPSPSPSSAPPSAATVIVPETSGDTQAVATGKLQALGLVVHTQTQEDPVATPGTVLGTVPTAGTEVPTGSDITLIIAKALASASPSPPPPASSHPAPVESLSPAGIASPH
jgi:hypothetical protein